MECIEYGIELYDYQLEISRRCISSLLVEPKDVFIKIARQFGKIETVTRLLRFITPMKREPRTMHQIAPLWRFSLR